MLFCLRYDTLAISASEYDKLSIVAAQPLRADTRACVFRQGNVEVGTPKAK